MMGSLPRRAWVFLITASIVVNLGLLLMGLKAGLDFRPPHPFVISNSPASSHKSTTELEEWRLDTEKEYVLDMAWDLLAPPKTRTFHFEITQGKGWPDGVERDMLFINSKFPGPLIEANSGDRIIVNITNLLPSEPTTMHWHGLRLKNSNWYDGTLGVTQCGIPPGASFVYNFTVGDDGQLGTSWYHSHFGAQYLDGILGPLVVHAPEEAAIRATYHQDRVVLLQDWYHNHSRVNLEKYLASGNENNEPIPDNGLINGRNFFRCSLYGSNSARVCHDDSDRAIFTLDLGTKTRIRLINAGAFAQFQFSIDNHPLTVIEADGTLTHPHTVHRLPIHVAQRYSVVVNADEYPNKSYWMRVAMVTSCFSDEDNPVLNHVTKATVTYSAQKKVATVPYPLSSDWEDDANPPICEDLDDGALVPLIEKPPPPATRLVVLDFHFRIGDYQLDRAMVNDTIWVPLQNSTTLQEAITGLPQQQPGTPLFQRSQFVIDVSKQMVDGNTTPRNTTESIVSAEVKAEAEAEAEVVDILIYSLDEGSHPFHLHGHEFWILQSGGGEFDWARYHSDIMPSRSDSIVHALRRDTFTIRPFSWALIRFVADNPGLWAFHCHMAWHMEAGLLVQFMSGRDVLRKADVPGHVLGLCDAGAGAR